LLLHEAERPRSGGEVDHGLPGQGRPADFRAFANCRILLIQQVRFAEHGAGAVMERAAPLRKLDPNHLNVDIKYARRPPVIVGQPAGSGLLMVVVF